MWIGLLAVATTAEAGSRAEFCSQTARTLFDACRTQVASDALVKKAVCLNVSDKAERETCSSDAADDTDEAKQLCRAQRDWRLDDCALIGEGRYDPDFEPAKFDDARQPSKPNPYFPLAVGDHWEYRGGNEVNTVDVVDESKLMEGGVECITVRDVVARDGDVAEATDDWYAHAKDGTTWYCGEQTAEFESFDGDDPRKPELVNIDGSFKAGRDGSKPGIIFLAAPKPGDVYLEEFSLANAEDVTQVLSTDYAYGKDADLDRLVPKALAERLCSGDCVVTKNFSLLEPGITARKYYSPGIGVFLEVEGDDVSQLVGCNFDARCVGLPTP